MVEEKKPKEIMDVRELTQYLGIGKSKIYALIRHKKIPASRIGRQYRFSKDVIDAWLRERIITKKEEPQMRLFKEKEDSTLKKEKGGESSPEISGEEKDERIR